MKKEVLNRIVYIGILMFMHFATDFLCASKLFSFSVDPYLLTILIVSYDALAFITQPLVGYLLEKYCNKFTLLFSMVLVVIGAIIPNIYVAVVLLGLGNSFFHVIGGKMTIDTSDKQTPLGLFVAPGALGLALGTYLPFNLMLKGIIIGLMMIAPLVMFLLDKPLKKEEVTNKKPGKLLINVLLIVVIAVVIRSFLGSFVKYDITLPYFVVLVGLCSTLGKLSGGIISDYMSPYVTIILSSIVAIIFMPFVSNVYMSLIGIFLFNLAMPVTLWMACKLFPNHKAFAFGLLAMLLAPSYFIGLALKPHYSIFILIAILVINGTLLFLAQLRLMRVRK